MSATESLATFSGLDLAASRLRACRHGLMLYLATDTIIGRALERYGEFAESENELMMELVKPGDVVIDVGANIGTVTLPLARRIQSHGKIYAFEPQRVIFQHLCANIALNGLLNVDARPAAVGASAGITNVPVLDTAVPANFGGVALSGSSTSEQVPVVAIDELKLNRCALIKIDVEGMEAEVLRGAAQTVAQLRPAIYFEAKPSASTSWCIAWLLEHNYRLYWHFASFFRKSNFRGIGENTFGDRGDINALALPAESPLRFDLPPVVGANSDWRAACQNWLAAPSASNHRFFR
jgi:FkbM family methyltransferase